MNTEKRKRNRLVSVLNYLRSSAFICGSFILFFGCTSAVQSGRSTALDYVDLRQMTDDMAGKIVADPRVQAAIGAEGSLAVVVQPVENRMVAEVLPRGPAQTFTARVRVLLSRHAPERFTWVMNRDAFYDLQARETEIDLGPPPERVQPRYALTSIFSSLTKEDVKRRSAYYLCEFQLTDLSGGNLLWSGSYEVKKIAVRQFLD